MTEKSIRKAGVGNQARKRSRRDGWPKAICDYLAGMTDRYLVLEHEPLTLTPGRHLRIGARSLGHDD